MLTTGWSAYFGLIVLQSMPTLNLTVIWCLLILPFTPFIGINKHGQSFMLGCAFIRDEKTPSYIWLFETFLEAMKGKSPVSIITDQDAAMRAAITQVFPNTNHKNC
jgi:hypothetical protein